MHLPQKNVLKSLRKEIVRQKKLKTKTKMILNRCHNFLPMTSSFQQPNMCHNIILPTANKTIEEKTRSTNSKSRSMRTTPAINMAADKDSQGCG